MRRALERTTAERDLAKREALRLRQEIQALAIRCRCGMFEAAFKINNPNMP